MAKDTDHTHPATDSPLELPEAVTVAVAELAGAAREGLLALAVGAGLQVLQAMLEEGEAIIAVWTQIAMASSSNATANHRFAGSSAASKPQSYQIGWLRH